MIQAVRRLYNPKGKKLPLPVIVELNRRLVKGYQTYKNDPRIINLKKSILAYNRDLMMLNIRDHQVSYAKFSTPRVVLTLLYRLGKLATLSIAVLPGTVLFAPVFIAGKIISIKKSREALAASSVKIKAKDVVATWKLLVAMALAPALYTFYTVILTVWTYQNRIGGRVPDWVPLSAIVISGYIVFPAITFASLRFGEVGMDIFKSLRPLILSLNPASGNIIHRLQVRRAQLVEEVTDVINELGPELFPDFDRQRLISEKEARENADLSPPQSRSRSGQRRPDAGLRMTSGDQARSIAQRRSTSTMQTRAGMSLPDNESFRNVGSFGVFSSNPGSPSSEHSHSGGRSSHDVSATEAADNKPLSNINSRSGFEEVSQKIRGAMRERGRTRKSEEVDGSWILQDEESETSDFEPEEAKKDI